MPVAQKQAEAMITKPPSFQMAKNLLRISLFQIAFIRNLFPSSYFSDRTVFKDLSVKVLNPRCGVSKRLVDWMEKGVCEALYKEYLKCLRFGITRDKEGKDLIEEYVFTFAYQADGEIRLQILNSIKKSPVNPVATESIGQLKDQVCKMTRLLVALMASFDPLPGTKFVSLHLEYYETRTPKSYEPPFFEAAPKLPHFEHKPFSMGLGACQTKDVCIGMKAKTTAVSDLDQECSMEPTTECDAAAIDQGLEVQGLEPSQMPQAEEDTSSLDTILTSVQLAGARASDDAMKTVGEMVAHQEKAAEWAEAKAGPNYNAAAAGFQGLSLGDGAMTPDKSANSTESQDHLVWDNIPASQPDSYTSLRRMKLSRGILGTNPTARAGPSKRIRMQERD